MAATYAAVDLGAESGRVVLGKLEGGRLELRELHRFRNGPVREESRRANLCWLESGLQESGLEQE